MRFVRIVETELTDGSCVYGVEISAGLGSEIILDCVAEERAQKLLRAIEHLAIDVQTSGGLSADPEECHEYIMLDRDKDGNAVLRPEGKE